MAAMAADSASEVLATDVLSSVAEYLGRGRDLAHFAATCVRFRRAAVLLHQRVLREDIRGEVFLREAASLLYVRVAPLSQLRIFKLSACRVHGDELGRALTQLQHSLVCLTLEMVKVHVSIMPVVVLPHLRLLTVAPPSSEFRIETPVLERLCIYRKALEDKCTGCGAARPSFKCSSCKFYAFCEKPCQLREWDMPAGHKAVCSAERGTPRTELDVGDVSDRAVDLVRRACASPWLRHLDLAHFWQKNVVYTATVRDGGAGVGNEDDDDVGDEVAARPPGSAMLDLHALASGLRTMRAMRLLRCGLTDDVVEVLCRLAPQLECLDISVNAKLTDVSLAHIGTLACLRDLRIRQNYRMTDSGLRHVARGCARLERVDLLAGVRIRNKTAIIVWHVSQPTLQLFGLNCSRLVELRGVWLCATPASLAQVKQLHCATAKDVYDLVGVQGADWARGGLPMDS